MNRRPSQSRTKFDSFSVRRAARFKASAPGGDFFDKRRKMPLNLRLTLYFFLLLSAVLLTDFVSNQFIHVLRAEVRITGLDEAFDGYTLLHISDLKGRSFGPQQGLLSFALGDSHFDAVVVTGDMVSDLGSAQPLYALIERLREKNPRAPIYFISGDSDPDVTSDAYFSGGSPFAPWVLGAQQRGAELLSSPRKITRSGASLWLTTAAQLTLDVDTMQGQYELQYLGALDSGDENAVELAAYHLKSLEEIRTARAEMPDGGAIITLMHTPPTDDDLAVTPESLVRQIDLVLCGHLLGGLMRLPLLGPVFIPSASLSRYGLFPGDVCSGLSSSGHTQIYASPGLASRSRDYPPFFFRLFNPPAVTLITLTPSAI